jgi:short subunit dehydrogenase-like uncharacterized protein
MKGPLLVYGATGYTGKLIAHAARLEGLDMILGGRSASRLSSLASELGVPSRAAVLDDAAAVERMLSGVRVVLNAAGPFHATAPPLIDACVRSGVHYLDVTGEAGVIAEAAAWHERAKDGGVMVMPAVGFDVVPSDCLAHHVARRVATPKKLFIGLSGLDLLTRGSAKTIVMQVGDPVWVRRGGALTRVPAGALERAFDYGGGSRPSVAVTWGDVVSAYFSTGIPDITVYSEATPAVRMHHALVQSFGWAIAMTRWREMLMAASQWMPEGPTDEDRRRRTTVIVVDVEDDRGHVETSRLTTPDAYSMTASTATAVARRVLAGDYEAGFQTPARVFGSDFPLSIEGVQRIDVASQRVATESPTPGSTSFQ